MFSKPPSRRLVSPHLLLILSSRSIPISSSCRNRISDSSASAIPAQPSSRYSYRNISRCIMGIEIQSLFQHAAFGPSAGLGLSRERVHQLSVSSTAACDSLQIGRPRFLDRSLHRAFEVIEWSKLVENWVHKMRQKNNPQLNVCTSLAGSYSSSQAATSRETDTRS